MFILEKPYVSEFLVDTIVQNDWAVLDNDEVENAGIEEGAFKLWSHSKAANYYLMQEYPLIYANSENAISWVLDNLPKSNLSKYISLFKDKAAFRQLIKDIYPNFYYQVVDYNALQSVNANDIKFPVVLKPAVGFLSFGVHTINNINEWNDTLKALQNEMKVATSLYPDNVISTSKFIIEELIEGTEYAIDAYYDRNGDVVILNIFEHPFLNKKDVRDRIYIMSVDIMIRYMAKFGMLLKQIGELQDIRNFPVHMEVRVKEDGTIIPIEVNPMRFAGWCTTDVAKYAWGINTYEYFNYQQRPDWNSIINNFDKKIYYFSMAEVPSTIPNNTIKTFDYTSFLANYSNILEVRRIDYTCNPLFAVIFGSTHDKHEINRILALKTEDYTECL